MLQIKINGVEHNVDADPQMLLLWAIRDIVGRVRDTEPSALSS